MSLVETNTPATPQALSAKTRSPAGRVQGKLRIALNAMVFEGLPLDKAAQAADLTTRALRSAIEKPHVRKYLREQKQVFRASVSSQNIHVLADLRDKSGNDMARLGAVKVLEQIDDPASGNNGQIKAPGFTIIVNTTDAKPTISATYKDITANEE